MDECLVVNIQRKLKLSLQRVKHFSKLNVIVNFSVWNYTN